MVIVEVFVSRLVNLFENSNLKIRFEIFLFDSYVFWTHNSEVVFVFNYSNVTLMLHFVYILNCLSIFV